METKEHKSQDLKPGDTITFDFRGGENHLGTVEVFDAYPAGRNVTQLVLLTADGEYKYRRVSDTTTFAVR